MWAPKLRILRSGPRSNCRSRPKPQMFADRPDVGRNHRSMATSSGGAAMSKLMKFLAAGALVLRPVAYARVSAQARWGGWHGGGWHGGWGGGGWRGGWRGGGWGWGPGFAVGFAP